LNQKNYKIRRRIGYLQAFRQISALFHKRVNRAVLEVDELVEQATRKGGRVTVAMKIQSD
jgi:hypothetical protein